jgi:hypothetical protein
MATNGDESIARGMMVLWRANTNVRTDLGADRYRKACYQQWTALRTHPKCAQNTQSRSYSYRYNWSVYSGFLGYVETNIWRQIGFADVLESLKLWRLVSWSKMTSSRYLKRLPLWKYNFQLLWARELVLTFMVQIMDPKMDNGYLGPGETLEDNYDVARPLLPEEIIGIMDQLLCHEVHILPK